MASLRSADLLAALVCADIVTVLAFTGLSNTVVMAVLAIPFVLVVPGYLVMTAAFAGRRFDIPELLLYSMGMSFVVVILGGLMLNLTPFGLEARSWSLFLGGFTLCVSAVAYVRRSPQGPSGPIPLRQLLAAVSPRTWLMFGLAVAVAAASITLAYYSAAQQENTQGYTVLWIAPAKDAGQQENFYLGVNNMQPTTVSYSLDVSVNGKIVERWQSIALKPHESWQVTLFLPSSSYVGKARIDAALYRSAAPSVVFRHVVLWLSP